MRKILYLLIFTITSLGLYAQGSVSGTIVDGSTGEGLIGASVYLQGSSTGTITDLDGMFKLMDLASGEYTLEISYVGYATQSMPITVGSGNTDIGTVSMSLDGIGLKEILIVADVAVDRKTPVAVSTLGTEEIEDRIGAQDLPELLKVTPSVYTTKSGGGYGDARINIRGFNQRNIAVLINGIPVNDMENGWVYWSNWAGLQDVTRSMQVQRGLGASKLAISSVGGTMNIVTKTTDQQRGGSVFTTYGNNNFFKAGVTLSTGRMDNGLAVTFSGSKTTGNGYIDATYIDAYSYFLSVAKEFGSNQQLVFTAIGAPQRHGQRTFREPLKRYIDTDLRGGQFTDLINSSNVSDFDTKVTNADGMDVAPRGSIRYNGDAGIYEGDWYNMRENFYHKPQFALNHYWNINEDMFLATSAYYSLGRGGGTGDRGTINGRGPWGYRNAEGHQRIDDIVTWNSGSNADGLPDGGKFQTDQGYIAGERDGIIKRASMNEHNWYGAISKLNWAITDNTTLTAGVDLRGYEGLHYRKVVDLMGTDAWLDPRDINDKSVTLDINGDGDTFDREEGKIVTQDEALTGWKLFGNPGQENKIHYDNDGRVNWVGAFAELEQSWGNTTGFVSASVSQTTYARVDRFNYEIGSEDEVSPTYAFPGYNLRAGFNHNLNDYMNVYFNVGNYSKAPTFDAVYPRFNNVDINQDASNESITGVEGGYGFKSFMGALNVNVYWTRWKNRSLFTTVDNADGTTGFANVLGVGALHRGIEVDFTTRPVTNFQLDVAVSLNDWKWRDNVEANIFNDDNVLQGTVNVFADGLYVGDAPQTQFHVGGRYNLPAGLAVDLSYTYFMRLYAEFDPTDRDTPSQRQALRLPDYGLMDGGLTYKINVAGLDARLRVNVNNILDELYVAEANDVSAGEGLEEAGGYFGFGRTWNVGLKVNF